MEVRQGQVYWVDPDEPGGSEPGYRHPAVVVQNNLFNSSRIGTVVVCMLTTNLRRARVPGNVLLEAGEAGPLKQSVVNVSQLFTVDRSQLIEYIGVLTAARVRQIVAGIRLLIQPTEVD